ncbi:hypothetical protein M427DRAFT_74533 [Gonapodya prolifera JEL478]|uniref:IPT/TIG domain-containing protein n=1 Tax=Gonapodya prolifera (strain JEL478) TaxID=1344416 RepID=A0A139A1C0_GONPJ|nr:hypothetical protein M427DRAFT_74533 [Gonapodya prolifera JEL478]|eukprot:KXS10153.1 hypothetical protein M427DRAFT_74533 [Gonapodya prolifera JEL478]
MASQHSADDAAHPDCDSLAAPPPPVATLAHASLISDLSPAELESYGIASLSLITAPSLRPHFIRVRWTDRTPGLKDVICNHTSCPNLQNQRGRGWKEYHHDNLRLHLRRNHPEFVSGGGGARTPGPIRRSRRRPSARTSTSSRRTSRRSGETSDSTFTSGDDGDRDTPESPESRVSDESGATYFLASSISSPLVPLLTPNLSLSPHPHLPSYPQSHAGSASSWIVSPVGAFSPAPAVSTVDVTWTTPHTATAPALLTPHPHHQPAMLTPVSPVSPDRASWGVHLPLPVPLPVQVPGIQGRVEMSGNCAVVQYKPSFAITHCRTLVSIFGTGFDPQTAVLFGPVKSPLVLYYSPTHIEALCPEVAVAQRVALFVVNAQAHVSQPFSFEYVEIRGAVGAVEQAQGQVPVQVPVQVEMYGRAV